MCTTTVPGLRIAWSRQHPPREGALLPTGRGNGILETDDRCARIRNRYLNYRTPETTRLITPRDSRGPFAQAERPMSRGDAAAAMSPSSMPALHAEMVEAMLNGVYRRFPHAHLHMVIDSSKTYAVERIRTALASTLDDFPVLRCRYRPGLWRDSWVPWPGPIDQLLTVAGRGASVDSATRRVTEATFDHRDAPPFRITLMPNGKGCRLVLSVHHMVADGGGIKAIANSFVSHLYHTHPDPPVSRDRRHLQVMQGIRIRDWPRLLREMLREAARPVAILKVGRVSHRFAEGNGDPHPAWATVTLKRPQTDAFHSRCREQGATINDGLVAVLLRLASRYVPAGPVAAAYTIDVRRHLRTRVNTVT
ncbi:MAG: hypothetical protein GF331_23100, partial [Chitinivibrionales bacterium]|nr:hypothetical protein [Chitinivibrionales bacterium]